MKKLPLLVAALLFSTLFYKQNIGLNLSLFSISTLTLLFIHNKKAFKKKSSIVFSIVYLITGISVFLYKSNLSIIANCVAFITIVGHISEHKSSIYVNWLNGLYTSIAGFFHRNFGHIEHKGKKAQNIDYLHTAKIIGIPILVVIIFIGLYKNGNPMFNALISKINFDFINLSWVLFTALGYYLFYNISLPIQVNPATEIDLRLENNLKEKRKESIQIEALKKEHQLGFILITLLNILITFFLVTDITYLVSSNDFRASVFSNQVHSGINALIASIIIAIIIILYFFRGDLNFYKDNETLKLTAYIWILLNVILIINIAIKDCQYIYYFGFTYKRIGVLVYLLLSIIGLLTTTIKVNRIKNFWYLLRVNSVFAFAILMISSMVNWDSHITVYNLYHAKSMDFNYLITLSNNNTFILKNYANQNKLSNEKKLLIDKKTAAYRDLLDDNEWQEFVYDNLKMTNK